MCLTHIHLAFVINIEKYTFHLARNSGNLLFLGFCGFSLLRGSDLSKGEKLD